MRTRRALALLCALCCIWSSLFSAAYAVDTLEDLEIDPWGDLGQLPDTVIQTPDPELAGELDGLIQDQLGGGEGEDVDLFALPSATLSGKLNNMLYYISYSQVPTFSGSAPSLDQSLGVVNSSSVQFEAQASSYYSIFYPVSLPKDQFESFTLNGYLISYPGFYISYGSSGVQFRYPSKVGLFVNNSQVGNYISLTTNVGGTSSSGFMFKNQVFNISAFYNGSDISQIEFRFIFDSYTHLVYTMPNSDLGKYAVARLYFQDQNLSISYQKVDFSGIGGDSEKEDQQHEETKGLLGTIISWLTSIRDGIVNVGTAIASLPGKIATAILDGLKSLFVPSAEEITAIKENYEDLLSERLGFIWQAGEWITSFGSDLLSALSGGAEAEFLFPGVGFDMNGEHYQLIEQQAVDFDSNGIVTVIRPFAGTICALVVVIACVNLFHDMVAALISGKNYFDFLKGGGDG